MANFPLVATSAASRYGFRISIAPPTASAEASMSGIKYSFVVNFSPTTCMPAVKPCVIIASRDIFCSSANCVSSSTPGFPDIPTSIPSSSLFFLPWITFSLSRARMSSLIVVSSLHIRYIYTFSLGNIPGISRNIRLVVAGSICSTGCERSCFILS